VTGEYSDPVTLTATLKDAFNNPLSGKSITFELGSQTATAPTGTDGVAQTTLTLTQAAGTYTLKASFAGDSTYAASSATPTFTITKEPATLAYTGDASLLTTATSFTLQASVTSEMDDPPGEITKARVTFYIYPSTSTTTPKYTSPSPIPATQVAPGVGVAKVTLACSTIGGCGENTWVVMVRLDPGANLYYQALEAPATLTFYTPNGQYVTGGGWVNDPSGSHGNFGFVVRYTSSGQVKGQFVYVYRAACPSPVSGICDYVVKATAWSALGFTSAAGGAWKASFQAKAVIQVNDATTGASVTSYGNNQLTVSVWDNTKTTNNNGIDQITVTVVLNGTVYHQVGTVTAPFSLKGGNIVVHAAKT